MYIFIKRSFASTALLSLFFPGLLFLNYSLKAQNTQPESERIFNLMFDAIRKVKTLKYNLFAEERIEDKYFQANSTVKVNVSPLKIYYKDLKKGVEALWIEGQEDNDALINPNGFPYVNLHLDPNGKLMHKDQHQTIERLGFAYIESIIYHSLTQFPDAYKKYVKYEGDTLCDGNSCYKIVTDFPDFHYYTILVKEKGETINSIADRFYLNNYLVLTANHMSSYEDVIKVGQILTIPNGYAKYTIILIRKDNHLPVYIKVYDDKGLFEIYAITNLQVNPVITDEEFTENYSGYHF